ncbi:F-box protein-like protein [Tanacetum coccineum]
MATTSNTGFEDIHADIIQTHILPLLDGPSLSNTSYVSHNLQSICSDHHLWSRISKSTWPSIIDPRVDDVISTFPARHRSFYHDSYPSLVLTDVSHLSTSKKGKSSLCYHMPNEIISAVDIHYENDIIYSAVKVTDTSSFSSGLIKIEEEFSRTIDLTVHEIPGADKAILLH